MIKRAHLPRALAISPLWQMNRTNQPVDLNIMPGDSDGWYLLLPRCLRWFNRHFLVQWTALWVIRVLSAASCGLTFTVVWIKDSPVWVGGRLRGGGLVCGNSSSIRTRSAHTSMHKHTHQISCLHFPLSIHVYLTKTWIAFLLDETE